jgi:hypothetical protein
MFHPKICPSTAADEGDDDSHLAKSPSPSPPSILPIRLLFSQLFLVALSFASSIHIHSRISHLTGECEWAESGYQNGSKWEWGILANNIRTKREATIPQNGTQIWLHSLSRIQASQKMMEIGKKIDILVELI